MIKQLGSPPILSNGMTVPLTPGISVNGLIFVSGQLGLSENGAIVEGGIEQQTHQAIRNMKDVLEKGGGSLRHVVKVTGWLTDEDAFPEFNNIYASYFSERPPARSMVISSLLVPGAVVELEAIAVAQ